MAARNLKKQKAKRKSSLQNRQRVQEVAARKEKAGFYASEAEWFAGQGNFAKALGLVRRALKRDPNHPDYLKLLVSLGVELKDPAVQLEGLSRLYATGDLDKTDLPILINKLIDASRFGEAAQVADELLTCLPKLRVPGKRRLKTDIESTRAYCIARSEVKRQKEGAGSVPAAPTKSTRRPSRPEPSPQPSPAASPPPATPARTVRAPREPAAVTVNLTVAIDSFQTALAQGAVSTLADYEVALAGHRIQFRDSFENLICLSHLKNVRSLWYQEETARKVLKRFRGRALLSDEVGLGKTIEAAMVLKEYMQRGMVRSALILTPTPLVSQWKEELKTKFELDFISTDDPDFRKNGRAFWENALVLASINQAKSTRNFEAVAARDYDMVIVDEAHHLKNRSTVNWKLVNALKKRFLLLLTATPVENNLMELYNLITLLKPGQLQTATAFRQEFMTRGDPTSPQNRHRLKELLGQVMIRNTRSLARLNIPPRFAQTIRIAPSQDEQTWYESLNTLVRDLYHDGVGSGHKLLLRSLLAEAGSSPRAVELTLARVLDKQSINPAHLERVREMHHLAGTLAAVSSKNKMVRQLIASDSAKIIIFVKYLGTLEHVSQFLSQHQIDHALFHGGMDNSAKDQQIDDFRVSKPVLLTTEIGGEGRNLQFCHRMINYDLPWNPMKIEQRIGRLHRIGQTSEVQIYNLCAVGSIEDYILEILDRKINMFEMVIGEIDMVLGRVQGEKEFSELVYDIWMHTASSEERQKGFDALGRRIQRSKAQYQATRTLDEKLFGENYEL